MLSRIDSHALAVSCEIAQSAARLFYRKDPVSGAYPVAVVRYDGQNALGSGQLGMMFFIVGALADSLKISITPA